MWRNGRDRYRFPRQMVRATPGRHEQLTLLRAVGSEERAGGILTNVDVN